MRGFKLLNEACFAVALSIASVTMSLVPARAQTVVFGFPEDAPVTSAEIEKALAAHGEWVQIPSLGRVWRPYADLVGDDFTPYLSNGRWLFGAYGWTFHSNYSWGWAAFHFGRWFFDSNQGWVWTTGGVAAPTWGPAWVTWRTGGQYVGWLPQLPIGVTEAPHQYASLWSVVHLRELQSQDLLRRLYPVDRLANAMAVSPPGIGAPVLPSPSWRGYPHLRETLAAATGALLFAPPMLVGANAGLWLANGASVPTSSNLGQANASIQLWTGPGSSVFASPGIGSGAPAQQIRSSGLAPGFTATLPR